MRRLVAESPGIDAVVELLTMRLGPDEVMVAARVDLDDRATLDQLEQAFVEMTEPTRENFMEALRSIEGFEAPLMLPDTSVTTSEDGQPAVSTVVVQKYNGRGYDTVESFQ